MIDPLKNPASNMLARAQSEIKILSLLQFRPMTIKEIAVELEMNPRTVKGIVQDLNAADVTYRDTRKICLQGIHRHGTG